jgi:hypothetical protein
MRKFLKAIGLVGILGCGEPYVQGEYDQNRPKVASPALLDVPIESHRYYESGEVRGISMMLLCKKDLRKNNEYTAIGEYTHCVDIDSLYAGYKLEDLYFDTNDDGKVDALHFSTYDYDWSINYHDHYGSCEDSFQGNQGELSAFESVLKEQYKKARRQDAGLEAP